MRCFRRNYCLIFLVFNLRLGAAAVFDRDFFIRRILNEVEEYKKDVRAHEAKKEKHDFDLEPFRSGIIVLMQLSSDLKDYAVQAKSDEAFRQSRKLDRRIDELMIELVNYNLRNTHNSYPPGMGFEDLSLELGFALELKDLFPPD